MKKDFELLEHTADIKVRVYGRTLDELFRHAVMGMFQAIGPLAPGCTRKEGRVYCKELPCSRRITVEAIDYESLLIDFLSEALYLSDVNNEAYLDATIHELGERDMNAFITATLKGVKITGFEVTEIKAVTYHDIQIKQVDGLWQTDIVFDI